MRTAINGYTEDAMERTMANETDQKLQGWIEGELNGTSRGATRGDFYLIPGMSPVQPAPRYQRFEPVTVRAAARVLQLQRVGIVTAGEAQFYLQELADMDEHASRGAYATLLRMAQRHLTSRPHAQVKRSSAELLAA
jgi:hypothetical protein